MPRALRETLWIAALAGVALLLTWAWFDFDWPDDETWVFYSPYSIYTVSPWPTAGVLFGSLLAVRGVAVWRRRRRRSTS